MNIFGLVKTAGPAALGPLKRPSDGSEVYYAAFDGAPVLKHGEWGPESSFATESEALSFAIEYAKATQGWKGWAP